MKAGRLAQLYKFAELRHHIEAGARLASAKTARGGLRLSFSTAPKATIELTFDLDTCIVIADRLGDVGRHDDAKRVTEAVDAFARETWDGLSPTMRDALLVAVRGRVWAPRIQTVRALHARKLAADWRHTREGIAVRDYGRELVGLDPEDAGTPSRPFLLSAVERSQAVSRGSR